MPSSSPTIRTAPVAESESGRLMAHPGVSWGAILAGVAGALVAQMILALLGLGLGLATVSPTTDTTPSAGTLSIGASVWWIVSGVVASALGGFLAGRLCGRRRAAAGYHGLVSWAVGTLLIAFLLSSAVGSLVSGAAGTVSSVLGGAGHAIGSAMQTAVPALQTQGDPLTAILDKVKTATGDQDPAALRAEAADAVRAVLTGERPNQQQALDHAADLLAKVRNIPVGEAKDQVAQLQQQYQRTVVEAEQKAEVVAENAARATSYTALVAAVALMCGAVAAFLAGRFGQAAPAV